MIGKVMCTVLRILTSTLTQETANHCFWVAKIGRCARAVISPPDNILVHWRAQTPFYANQAALELLHASSTRQCRSFVDAQIGNNPGLLLVLDGMTRYGIVNEDRYGMACELQSSGQALKTQMFIAQPWLDSCCSGFCVSIF